jgi:sugar phosphate isomerase/epimerase
MRAEVYKSLWGMKGALDLDLGQIEDAGYDGFEFDLPEVDGVAELRAARRRRPALRYFALIRTVGPDHLASFSRELERAAALEADHVTAASGEDWMSRDDARRFFEGALELQRTFEIPVSHETHRGTTLFTPWHTAALLTEFPALRITADYSHWCCVCERMLDDQAANVATCNARAVHIHGRVGHPGGPQVNDPRAPENAGHLHRHEAWWREIVVAQLRSGAAAVSFDPEFGPPPDYMPSVPFTGAPVADLWDVCSWMTERFRALVAEVSSRSDGAST